MPSAWTTMIMLLFIKTCGNEAVRLPLSSPSLARIRTRIAHSEQFSRRKIRRSRPLGCDDQMTICKHKWTMLTFMGQIFKNGQQIFCLILWFTAHSSISVNTAHTHSLSKKGEDCYVLKLVQSFDHFDVKKKEHFTEKLRE